MERAAGRLAPTLSARARTIQTRPFHFPTRPGAVTFGLHHLGSLGSAPANSTLPCVTRVKFVKLGKVSQAQPLLEKCQLEIITLQSGLGKSGEGDMGGGLVQPKRPIG